VPLPAPPPEPHAAAPSRVSAASGATVAQRIRRVIELAITELDMSVSFVWSHREVGAIDDQLGGVGCVRAV
jgi:hypothetical protein